jgi:hypothetical protein
MSFLADPEMNAIGGGSRTLKGAHLERSTMCHSRQQLVMSIHWKLGTIPKLAVWL